MGGTFSTSVPSAPSTTSSVRQVAVAEAMGSDTEPQAVPSRASSSTVWVRAAEGLSKTELHARSTHHFEEETRHPSLRDKPTVTVPIAVHNRET